MENTNQIKCALREEYSNLFRKMQKIQKHLDARIRFALGKFFLELKEYERIEVRSRIKTCESAIDKLKKDVVKRTQKNDFDPSKKYSISSLNDLVGFYILVFPVDQITEIRKRVNSKFKNWQAHDKPAQNIYQLQGFIKGIGCEIQIIPMLTGLFWEIEHFTYYKPHSSYKESTESIEMQASKEKVLSALSEYDKIFTNISNHLPI